MWPLLGIAVVRGRSMEPTLRDGDRLLVRYGARTRPNALVVVRLPDRPIAVKRGSSRSVLTGPAYLSLLTRGMLLSL